jgi:cysteine desulfurase
MKRIYLDYASTTPLDKKVLKAMLPFMKGDFGNPVGLICRGSKSKRSSKRAARKK